MWVNMPFLYYQQRKKERTDITVKSPPPRPDCVLKFSTGLRCLFESLEKNSAMEVNFFLALQKCKKYTYSQSTCIVTYILDPIE